ncbi:MAG: acetylornithine deacetylase [Deltaproteobacteria bacterium]
MIVRDILGKLVSFPTVSRDSNLALIDWVEDWLKAQGVLTGRVPNADGTKASLWAHIGPMEPGGVILNGHTDVVPVEGQTWTSDPWTLSERDGRLYGRGTCDMKGFLALAMAAIPLAKQGNLKKPLQLAFSHDEEVGCMMAVPLIEAMAHLPKAESVIVGEPSMMGCITGHKGGLNFAISVKGHPVHSSMMHTGVSAVMEAAKLITWANDQNARLMAEKPTTLAALFDPPWTNVHVGVIQGGTAQNITAQHCAFDIGFRFVAGDDPEEWRTLLFAEIAKIDAGMKAIHPDAGMVAHERFSVNGLKPEEDGAAERLVRALTGDNQQRVVSYGTEAGHFQAAGYSTVVCGPGDIAQAHQADEFVSIAQLESGWAFMERLVETLRD